MIRAYDDFEIIETLEGDIEINKHTDDEGVPLIIPLDTWRKIVLDWVDWDTEEVRDSLFPPFDPHHGKVFEQRKAKP